MKLDETIKALRETLGISQQGMADRLKVALPTYQKWEWGKSRPAPKGLTGLYFLAREGGRTDLAVAIMKESTAPSTVPLTGGGVGPEPLLHLDGCFAAAVTRLTESLIDVHVSSERRSALMGETIDRLLDGRRLIERLLQEFNG